MKHSFNLLSKEFTSQEHLTQLYDYHYQDYSSSDVFIHLLQPYNQIFSTESQLAPFFSFINHFPTHTQTNYSNQIQLPSFDHFQDQSTITPEHQSINSNTKNTNTLKQKQDYKKQQRKGKLEQSLMQRFITYLTKNSWQKNLGQTIQGISETQKKKIRQEQKQQLLRRNNNRLSARQKQEFKQHAKEELTIQQRRRMFERIVNNIYRIEKQLKDKLKMSKQVQEELNSLFDFDEKRFVKQLYQRIKMRFFVIMFGVQMRRLEKGLDESYRSNAIRQQGMTSKYMDRVGEMEVQRGFVEEYDGLRREWEQRKGGMGMGIDYQRLFEDVCDMIESRGAERKVGLVERRRRIREGDAQMMECNLVGDAEDTMVEVCGEEYGEEGFMGVIRGKKGGKEEDDDGKRSQQQSYSGSQQSDGDSQQDEYQNNKNKGQYTRKQQQQKQTVKQSEKQQKQLKVVQSYQFKKWIKQRISKLSSQSTIICKQKDIKFWLIEMMVQVQKVVVIISKQNPQGNYQTNLENKEKLSSKLPSRQHSFL